MRRSKQKVFCNCCGKDLFIDDLLGRRFRCCSMECIEEMEWKSALSICGKEYYPKPKKQEEK